MNAPDLSGGEGRLTIDCPLGSVEITGTEAAVRRIRLAGEFSGRTGGSSTSPVLRECARQLGEYFQGARRDFDVPLDLKGTAFERLVWKKLLQIPYGRTASYKDIARRIGRPDAMRAVGAANGKNPAAIIVPCHRIIGHDGRLVGYGGGLWRKKWLLEHERFHSSRC